MTTIFVSVASYRDKSCSNTIKEIYSKSKFPQNIYVGICQQNKKDEKDENCLNNYLNPNIRIVNMDFKDARGPCLARYYCSHLYKNEDYFLQIDSHTKFVKNWDIKILSMMKKLEENGIEKPIISYYPRSDKDKIIYQDRFKVPIICDCTYMNNGIPFLSSAKIYETNNEMFLNVFVTGGFFICHGRAIREVPFLNNLDDLFQGEEILMSLRFFTHGYNVYTPSENICFHYYTRENDPKIWNDKVMDDTKAVKFINEILNKKYKHTLGNKRSIDDFYKFLKILPNKKMFGNFCVDF